MAAPPMMAFSKAHNCRQAALQLSCPTMVIQRFCFKSAVSPWQHESGSTTVETERIANLLQQAFLSIVKLPIMDACLPLSRKFLVSSVVFISLLLRASSD
jgi:hypothetical protein